MVAVGSGAFGENTAHQHNRQPDYQFGDGTCIGMRGIENRNTQSGSSPEIDLGRGTDTKTADSDQTRGLFQIRAGKCAANSTGSGEHSSASKSTATLTGQHRSFQYLYIRVAPKP